MMDNIFSERLQALQTQGLYRKMANMHSRASATASIDGKTCDIFCSNNYLTLANHPDMISKIKAGLDQWGFGTGSSRLINGNTTAHINLQHRLATLLGQEDALIFPTGFMTNYGLLSVIGKEGDLIIFDKLAHASIIDGAIASKATVRSFPHKNYDRLVALPAYRQSTVSPLMRHSILFRVSPKDKKHYGTTVTISKNGVRKKAFPMAIVIHISFRSLLGKQVGRWPFQKHY
jgi:7-keto-8-aminopelargonate synthetase-like enzyme